MQNQIYNLVKLLTEFQLVDRGVVVPGTNRKENDTEHSYNLALAAWLIIEKDNLPLDLNLSLKYALVHDLVEVYAGDSFALDPKQVAKKAEKEQDALQLIAADPITMNLVSYIEDYEGLKNEEAKFIYSLDKLMPAFGVLYGKELIWKNHGMNQSDWEDKFRVKIEVSKFTKPYLDFVISEQKAHPELFVA